MKSLVLAFITTLALSFTPVLAADFLKGLHAAQTGDYATALREWAPLAERGDAAAQFNLGLMYENGRGVPQDYAQAVTWYKRAAEQGDAIAQTNLGAAYANGKGVPQDYILAHMWFNISSTNGSEKGRRNRGLAEEFMTPADISKARQMASKCLESCCKNCGY